MSRSDHMNRKKICCFIAEYYLANGYAPCVRDIGFAVGLASTSTVHGHLSRLMRDGYVTNQPGKPRSLVPTRKLFDFVSGETDHGQFIIKDKSPAEPADDCYLIQPYIDPIVFGSLLANARKARRMTRNELASLSGVSYSTVCAHERGRTLPSLETIEKYSAALKAPVVKPIAITRNLEAMR